MDAVPLTAQGAPAAPPRCSWVSFATALPRHLLTFLPYIDSIINPSTSRDEVSVLTTRSHGRLFLGKFQLCDDELHASPAQASTRVLQKEKNPTVIVNEND